MEEQQPLPAPQAPPIDVNGLRLQRKAERKQRKERGKKRWEALGIAPLPINNAVVNRVVVNNNNNNNVRAPELPVLQFESFPVGSKHVFGGLALDLEHLKLRGVDTCNQPDIKDQLESVDSIELLKLLEDGNLADQLHHGVDYSGTQMFRSVAAMKPNLEAILKYAETSALAAPDIKSKMRFVALALRGNKDAYGIVVMLATHGGVCNVMKEVGIRCAYAALAGTLASEFDSSDPRNAVLKVLYELRELCVESLYIVSMLKGKRSTTNLPTVNTHNVIGYRNGMAADVGLDRIPDPNISGDNAQAKTYLPHFFERFYHVQVVIDCVAWALNEEPRKLNYNSIVSYLQYNRPEKFGEDVEEFLYHCFDVNGKFTNGCVAWLLYRMGILKLDQEGASIDYDKMFPPIDDEDRDEIRASREANQNRENSNNNPLAVSHVVVNLRS